MSTVVQGVYFLVSLSATLLAAAVFADRLDRLGERLGLPEALLGLLTAAGADAPELAAAITAVVTGAKGTARHLPGRNWPGCLLARWSDQFQNKPLPWSCQGQK